MVEIFNSPQDASVIEVEARKSFTFGMWFVDSRKEAVDLTGATITLTVTKLDRYGVATVVLSTVAFMADAAVGYATVNLQASQLNVKPMTYQFAITLRVNGYSVVVMKGDFTVRQNAEYASVANSFLTANPSQNLEVQLRNQTNVHLELSTVLPPNLVTPTDASDAAVASYVADSTSLTSQQLDIRFVTHAELTAALAPMNSAIALKADKTYVDTQIAPKADKTYVDTQDGARVARNIFTAKGQILTASASSTPGVLSVGPNGQVLIASSGTSTGLRWANYMPTGSLFPWAGGSNTAPAEFLFCLGQAVSRTTYATLFGVIGTVYGAGDGSTTFNVPNLQGRVPVGHNATDTDFQVLGGTGGSKTNTHNHYTGLGADPDTGNFYIRPTGSTPRSRLGNAVRIMMTGTRATGAYREDSTYDETISTLSPFLVLRFIIKI